MNNWPQIPEDQTELYESDGVLYLCGLAVDAGSKNHLGPEEYRLALRKPAAALAAVCYQRESAKFRTFPACAIWPFKARWFALLAWDWLEWGWGESWKWKADERGRPR